MICMILLLAPLVLQVKIPPQDPNSRRPLDKNNLSQIVGVRSWASFSWETYFEGSTAS
jgi:hypothetical protein